MTKLYNSFKPYLLILAVIIFSTLLLWLPFILKTQNWAGLAIKNPGFQYILSHFDGPLYVVVAKTFYDPQLIKNLNLELTLPPIYFAAHLPFYPLLIKLFAPILGYLKSMIFVNITSTILLGWFFYFFINKLKLTKNPLLLTVVFLFLPRFLIVRSVGAPESLFLLLILLSLYFFEAKNYLWAGIFGGLSVATKTPGILLFAAYSLVLIEHYSHSGLPRILRGSSRFNRGLSRFRLGSRRVLWLFLIPLTFVVVFALYFLKFGDFFAYFNSGDNLHLVYPYSAFNFQKVWVGTAWLEDIVFYFFIYALTVVALWQTKYRSLFYFALTFFIAAIFVQHRDIARYSLPLWPLACIAFARFFTSKSFLIAFLIILPALYHYGWNFLLYNVMPISNWLPYL